MSDQATPVDFDESASLKGLQRDVQAIVKQLDALTKIKLNDADALEKFQKAVAGMPAGEQLAKAVDEIRSRAEQVIASARTARADAFRRHEADFIREAKSAGKPVREVGSNSWRIGPVEIEFQRENSRARVLYNRQALAGWTPIASREGLEKLLADAQKALESVELPADTLAAAFSEAYDHLRRQQSRADGSAIRVPLLDFFREVRVVLTRHELRSTTPERKLTRTEFPRWAFLYNLDRYRQLLAQLPAQQRLSFETGSQHDHQKGLAMVANGLDANADYKSYCYVYAAPAPQV